MFAFAVMADGHPKIISFPNLEMFSARVSVSWAGYTFADALPEIISFPISQFLLLVFLLREENNIY